MLGGDPELTEEDKLDISFQCDIATKGADALLNETQRSTMLTLSKTPEG